MSLKVFTVNHEKCTGCMSCVEACSIAHEGKSSYRRSRIAVTKDKASAVFVPLVCELCQGRCLVVCPEEAISFNQKLGTPVIDEEKCNGCMTCVRECPFSGIIYDRVNHKALKCDLCGGDPVCVKVCQPGALVPVEPGADTLLEKYRLAVDKMSVYNNHIRPKAEKYRKKNKQASDAEEDQ